MSLAFAAGCDLLADLAHELRRNRHNVPVGKIQRGGRGPSCSSRCAAAPSPRKQKLLRRVSVIAFAWLSSIVHMSASLPSDARCTAIAVPKLPAPRIVIFISLPPFTFTRRAPARPLDFFIIAQRGDGSRRRVRARIGCKKPERRNTAPAPMLRSLARSSERLAVCTLNVT